MTRRVAFLACLAIAVFLSSSVSGQSPCPTNEQALTQRCRGPSSRPWLVTTSNQSDPCCPLALGPVKLVETGDQIVNPQNDDRFASAGCATGGTPEPKGCFDPPAFYKQYSNVYTTDFTQGIPILSDTALNATFATVRRHMALLLKWSSRIIPNIAEHLSRAYIRVAINSCGHHANGRNDWSMHPEAASNTELGGGSRDSPTVGAEESGTPSGARCNSDVKFPVSLEEFFHTIHHVGMRELDPDAFIAITCLSARDVEQGIYSSYNLVEASNGDSNSNNNNKRRRRRRQAPSPSGMPPSGGSQGPQDPTTLTEQERIQALENEYSDWAYTVGLEYYISAVATWMGLPSGELVYTVDGERNVSSRAEIKSQTPDLACLIDRYFPDVDEDEGSWCPDNRTSPRFCALFPGSCFCGSMTAEYLGPALDRTKCKTLKEIKEGSTYHNRTLPGNANQFMCTGCTVSGCHTDRGEQRTSAPNASVPTTASTGMPSAAKRPSLHATIASLLAAVALLLCHFV